MPRDPCTAPLARLPSRYGLDPFTRAGALGWKEQPRIAELKKANAEPKGGTLAHRRATSRRSRSVAPQWLPPAKNADVGATSAKSGKKPHRIPGKARVAVQPANL